jgi:glycosyltransferase involved in cell wall biosynthesis
MTAPSSISVIIPAYNAAEFIGDSLSSVKAQAIQDLQIIVVDDGSTDGTADRVAAEHPDVELIRKANGGAATARNRGIAAAHGDYLAFLDADDIWLPGKLAAQWRHLQAHPDIHLVCTGFERWQQTASGRYPPLEPLIAEAAAIPDTELDTERSGWIYHQLLLDCHVWTSTVMLRRAILERTGTFDESLRLGQDYDFWLRASRVTPIHTLRRPMALYRQHPDSATVRGASVNYGARVLTRAVKQWGYSSPNGQSVSAQQVRKRIAAIHFDLGYRRYCNADYRLAAKDFASSLSKSPGQPRTWLYLIVSSILMFAPRRSEAPARSRG